MMDLKEIIKWLLPCFHILLKNFDRKSNMYLLFISLFLLLNSCPSYAAKINSDSALDLNSSSTNNSSNILNINANNSINQSDATSFNNNVENNEEARTFGDTSVGRTFGLRFRKMAAALIPLAFQMGSAATWAIVAALVGVKTLAVTLLILKLLLLAAAVKIGAFFGQKSSHGWQPPHVPHLPQKEIHLHIHNTGGPIHGYEEPTAGAWSRDGTPLPATLDTLTKNLHPYYEPYSPPAINTPYGNYVKAADPTKAARH